MVPSEKPASQRDPQLDTSLEYFAEHSRKEAL
jgi:hypothetical protein